MRPLAAAGIPGAQRRLARLLAGQGRLAEALVTLPEALLTLPDVPVWRDDVLRVERWLASRGENLVERYVDPWRRSARDEVRRQLAWVALVWWSRHDIRAAVALLDDVGPDEWLHRNLVRQSRHRWSFQFGNTEAAQARATAIDLLAEVNIPIYQRTRALLLWDQGRRDDAVAALRTAAATDTGAARELAGVLAGG
ncbi:hypothetical protein [Krasilnikovia sp. MM14-A1259]|uniref:hypothetical protein n=1 Tax=Krasilnikovia sp. MM14-A1259 TaxID=3373539 RepID=UPI00399CF4BF